MSRPVSDTDELLVLTTDIVASYLEKNVVPAANLSDLIQTVHRSLVGLAVKVGEVKTPAPEPAVPVKRSIQADAISCLECGKRFRSLKRHLSTHHDETPGQYRERWGLPADYPMVAPDYAAARSQLARKMGLGQRAKGSRAKKKA